MPRARKALKKRYELRDKVWLYPGMAGWNFLSLPKNESDEIRERYSAFRRGWGSLPTKITIGKTSWKTSIFPDRKAGVYLLPLKADVRKREDIGAGDVVAYCLEVVV
jgi:hypothetical protein